jgi:hypothetical protein
MQELKMIRHVKRRYSKYVWYSFHFGYVICEPAYYRGEGYCDGMKRLERYCIESPFKGETKLFRKCNPKAFATPFVAASSTLSPRCPNIVSNLCDKVLFFIVIILFTASSSKQIIPA